MKKKKIPENRLILWSTGIGAAAAGVPGAAAGAALASVDIGMRKMIEKAKKCKRRI